MFATRNPAWLLTVLFTGILTFPATADVSIVNWELNTFTSQQSVSTLPPPSPLPFSQTDTVPSPAIPGQSSASSTYAFTGPGGTATFNFAFAHELNTTNVGHITGSDGYLSFTVTQDTPFALTGSYGFVGTQQTMVATQSSVDLLLGDNISGSLIQSFDPSISVGYDGILQAGQLYTLQYSYSVVPHNPSSLEVDTYAGTAAGSLSFTTAVPAPGSVVLALIGLGSIWYAKRTIRPQA